ncbi:MAG: zf-HC2 domain-containing protein [Lachnospiraceae bacterium]|nr:zf-HC2 domain-containing protein [Lachnospiraceae bacterium]
MNNNISCDVILDLLPLYEDGCCSEQSQKLVEEHLKECADCKKKVQQYQESLLPESIQSEVDEEVIKKGIQKINRWRIRGIVSVCLVISLLLVLLPAWNYARGEGLTYANLRAVYTAYAFGNALASGDYEKAYDFWDMESHYNDLLATNRETALMEIAGREATEAEIAEAKAVDTGIRQIKENGFEWYNEVCKKKFIESMESLEAEGEMIRTFSNFDIMRQAFGWEVCFDAITASGQEFELQLDISSEGIKSIRSAADIMLFDYESGELIENSVSTQKAIMRERLYRSPSVNETVMKILYDDTDYDWTKLFIY